MVRKILPLLLIIVAAGCAPTTIEVPLSNTLGLEAFTHTGTIERRNISIGLFIAPELKDLVLTTNQGDVVTKFYVGRNFTLKLIKMLTLNVNKIKLLDQRLPSIADKLDATLVVELGGAEIIHKKAGIHSFEWTSESWLAVQATLKDSASEKIVWEGTPRAESKGRHINLSIGISRAIERTVAQLIRQMFESENFDKYVRLWELIKP